MAAVLAPLLRRPLTPTPVNAYDLSDLQPPAFAATAGQGRWDMFQRYLSGARSIEQTMRHLKRGSGQARRCERANAGIC